MPVRDEAMRREIEAAFERGLSPKAVGMEWKGLGDFHYLVEGLEPARIARAHLSWPSAMNAIQTIRGDLRRRGEKLDDWEPPPLPTSC